MAAVGKPSENGYAERVIRTIKEEEVYLSDYNKQTLASKSDTSLMWSIGTSASTVPWTT